MARVLGTGSARKSGRKAGLVLVVLLFVVFFIGITFDKEAIIGLCVVGFGLVEHVRIRQSDGMQW